jgi:hypothetical protein
VHNLLKQFPGGIVHIWRKVVRAIQNRSGSRGNGCVSKLTMKNSLTNWSLFGQVVSLPVDLIEKCVMHVDSLPQQCSGAATVGSIRPAQRNTRAGSMVSSPNSSFHSSISRIVAGKRGGQKDHQGLPPPPLPRPHWDCSMTPPQTPTLVKKLGRHANCAAAPTTTIGGDGATGVVPTMQIGQFGTILKRAGLT